MALTSDLVAKVHRVVEDAGPDPSIVYHTEDDYNAVMEELLASHPEGADVWLFAHGSLIWKPEFDHIEERTGTAHGWHRAFCLRITRWRGTVEKPGLMMALDRGGECRGVVYRLANVNVGENLGKRVRREMTAKPPTNVPRWLTVKTDLGSVRALAFVANPKGGAYAGKVSLEMAAEVIAEACGHWGSCAEYLHNTVKHLEERGIRDRSLWRLQHLVADRISALPLQ